MYPEIMTSLSGNRITTVEYWEKYRRDEIMMLLKNFIYGETPIDRPEDISFAVEEIHREQNILQKKVTISFCGYEIGADIFLPEGTDSKLPAYLMVMHQYEEEKCNVDQELDFEIIPILDIVKRGYAIVAMKNSRLVPDMFEGEKFKEGIFRVLGHSDRGNAWGIISAWAWGASRVMDYLETDPQIDASKVIVAGHSRSGKTALWTAACDQRFAMAVSNDSGCSGAAFTRNKIGEHLEYINRATDWFCENYKKYNTDEDMLPFDQHMLLAAIAPRPLYVASSSEDDWADPYSERLSCRMASEVYELYGKTGVVLPRENVEDNVAYHEGMIGYHCKSGNHGITKFDWNYFMDFSDKYVK